jgi:hypothetical protein
MAIPSEVADDESGGETTRLGDHNPIFPPSRGFVDLLSEAPRSSRGVTGRDVVVGGGFGGDRRAPSLTLCVGLARSNNASTVGAVLPGGRGMGAGGRQWRAQIGLQRCLVGTTGGGQRRRGLGRCGWTGMGAARRDMQGQP